MRRINLVPVADGGPSALPSVQKSVIGVVRDAGIFTVLARALDVVRVAPALDGPGRFTLFAPTDEAFAKLPIGSVDVLLRQPERLAGILMCHILTTQLCLSDILGNRGAQPRTLAGQPLHIRVRDGKVFVETARMVGADIRASNGVLHVIDEVLLATAAPLSAAR